MADKYIVARRVIANQFIDYTSVSAQSSVFTGQTYILRLAATSPIHYHIFSGTGASSTCDSTDPLLPSNYEIIGVQPGARVSVIKAAGLPTSGDGRVTITELA
jgi:hypothetical protein